MVCARRPNTYFVFGRICGTRPGHAKPAGDEQEVVATKKTRGNEKEEAGRETQHVEDARQENAKNAQAHTAKEEHCPKQTAISKTSNGQYAGDEDARNEDADNPD